MELPVATGVPPQEPVYQRHTAPLPSEPPLTLKIAVSFSHIGDGMAVAEPAAVE